MKIIRILLSILGLLIFVAIVAVAGLLFFVNPNKLKPVITEEVLKQTGYHLAIDGNLSWSFYPTVGVKVDHLTITAPQGSTPFVDAKNVTIATELSKLLHGEQVLQGDVNIGDMTIMHMHATGAHVKLIWQDHVLTLDPITAYLYSGTLEGKAHGKELSTIPSWGWDVELNQVQLKPLLQDVNGADSRVKIAGAGKVKISVATKGNTREQVLSNLNGVTIFSLNNGVIEGADLNYIVKSADAIINKQPIMPEKQNLTTFESFTGGAVIKNGVAETSNLVLQASTFKTTGTGSVNLNYQAVNLQLQIASQNVQTKWEIPVLVTGSLNRPDVRLDTTELQKLVFQNDFDKVKNKVKNEVKNHIPGKAGEFIQNLLSK